MGIDFSAFAEECPSALVMVSADGSIVFANRSLASLLGFGLLELERARFSSIVPPRFQPTLDRVDWVEHLADRTTERRHLDWALLHRSGVELEVEWTAVGGHDVAGRPLALILFSAHRGALTPEPFALTQPSNAEQIHQIIFENAPIGIFHFDGRGVLTAANERFVDLIGSSRRHLVGLAMLTLPNTAIAECVREVLAGRLANYEGSYTSATAQKTSWVRVVMAPVKDSEQCVIGGVGLVDDISSERSARDLLSRAERLASLGTLAAGVVHEVQNPLAYVTANLELAMRQLEGDMPIDPRRADLTSALSSAREGAERVAAIVRDLKTFARSDDAIRAPVTLRAVIEAAEKLTQNHVRHRARLELRLETDATVWASESRLVQLFVNLLLNAADAIPEGAADENRIIVASHTLPDGRVRVEVEDTGCGISREVAAHIFEPFWTDKPAGMGLGLAICLGIVASLGGEIFVESDESPSSPHAGVSQRALKGARLVVVLPSAAGDLEQPRDRPTPAITSNEPLRGRVLIIDDEVRLAETLRIALSESHDVEVATRGKQALELLLGDDGYDVVLCDLLLPDLTGVDIFEQISRRRPHMVSRFVFLTGGAFGERTRDFLQNVPNPRLEKPFDLESLERIVADQVALARAQV